MDIPAFLSLDLQCFRGKALTNPLLPSHSCMTRQSKSLKTTIHLFLHGTKPSGPGSPTPIPTLLPQRIPTPSPLELPADPVRPITMTSYLNPAPQNGAHAKGYGLNKPMPFSSDRTKIKAFLQECLVYIDMNEEIYMTDRLKIQWLKKLPQCLYVFQRCL